MLHGMNNILLSNNCYITISNVYWPVPAINIIYPVGLVVPSSTNVEYLLCPYRTLRRKDDCWHFQGSKLLRLSFSQSPTFNSPLTRLTSCVSFCRPLFWVLTFSVFPPLGRQPLHSKFNIQQPSEPPSHLMCHIAYYYFVDFYFGL